MEFLKSLSEQNFRPNSQKLLRVTRMTKEYKCIFNGFFVCFDYDDYEKSYWSERFFANVSLYIYSCGVIFYSLRFYLEVEESNLP